MRAKTFTASQHQKSIKVFTKFHSSLDNVKSFLPVIQGRPNLDGISGDATRVAHWLINLARNAATHIRRPHRGEESLVIQLHNMVLPLISSLNLGIDVLDVIGLNLGNGVGDPPALDRD